MSYDRLTARQREAVILIAEGPSNAEIAERLTVRSGTVGDHVSLIIRRLGLRNQVQLAVWAIRHGLYCSED